MSTLDTPQNVPRLASHPGWRTTFRNAMIITRREVTDSFRDWRIIAPIFVLTFLFPALSQFIAQRFEDFLTGFGAEIIGERTIPFLLMVVGFFPISISLVIALETFVGEKERRSLEPLLSTPLSNTELYIGKTLAAMIPPLLSSFGGMIVYLSSVLFSDLAWRPAPMLIVQIMLLTTVQALVMVTGAVVVSSQSTSTRSANLLASFIVIPMAMVIIGESTIMFLAPDAESQNGIAALWAIIVGMFFVAVLLVRVGNAIFNREELLGRSLDSLNLRGSFQRLWQSTISIEGDSNGASRPYVRAKGLLDWYRRGVFPAVGAMRGAVLTTVIVFIGAFFVGLATAYVPEYRLPIPPDLFSGIDPEWYDNVMAVLDSGGVAVQFYVVTNGRILLAALILGSFSFGVGALVLTPAVYGVLGFIAGQLILSNNSLLIMAAAVIPHGLIEVPVIVLSVAAAVQLGAIVTRPPAGFTVGQAWMKAFGRAMKVSIGLVLPGLILAGIIESLVTPQVLGAVLRTLIGA